jgi:hypothetical protein
MTWIWVAATTATTGFLAMVLVLGATVFRSRDWDEAFTAVAQWEEERRGLNNRKLSQDEKRAIRLMLGPEPARPEDSGSPFRGVGLHTFSVLSGYGDVRVLAADVVERREERLGEALRRQLLQVKRFGTVRWASRAWVVQKQLSRIEVAVRGMVWLLPRSLNEISAIVKEYSTKLGVVAVFLSSPYWLLVRNQDGSGLSAPDVIALLTKLVLPGLVLWAMGVLLFRVLVARAGHPRSWPKRAVLTAGLAAATSVALVAAADFIGEKLRPIEEKWLAHVDSNDPATVRVFEALLVAGFLWIACGGAVKALDKTMLMSGRVGALSSGTMLVAISIPMAGLAATGTVASPLSTAMYGMLLAACILGLVSLAYLMLEWIERYRTLMRDGVKVPRRGFSWWLVGAWVLSMITVLVPGAIQADLQNSAIELALLVPELFATLGLFPIAIVSTLFVRRVNAHFERHMTADWPET